MPHISLDHPKLIKPTESTPTSNPVPLPREIIFEKKLFENGSAGIFVVQNLLEDRVMILKVQKPKSLRLLNECRFIHLEHPNIIGFHCIVEDLKIPGPQNSLIPRTGILMELAPYGDFHSIFFNDVTKPYPFVRTYFKQLIDGVKYLHQ